MDNRNSPQKRGSLNRRRFIQTAAALSAASYQRVRGANDRIGAGFIGYGLIGKRHVVDFKENPGVNMVAMAETHRGRLDEALTYIGGSVKGYGDFREMLDNKDVDAVCISTADHWHALMTMLACAAGKDVYVEKPLSHNCFEGRKAVEAARKYNRIVQHGTQNRSSPEIIEGVRKLKEGVIGDVYMARGLAFKWRPSIGKHQEGAAPQGVHYDLWKGPAPDRPFSNLRLHNKWHWQWDYGNGELGNQGVHQLDLMRWALDLGVPERTQSMGGKYVHDDDQETPNTQSVQYQYEGRDLLLTFDIRPWITHTEAGIGEDWPTHGVCTGLTFYGTEGYMVLPHYAAYYTFLGKSKKPGPFAEDPTDKIKDQPHFDNFIQAVRSRKQSDLTADVEEGHKSSLMAHLGNIAYRTKRQAVFDPQSETIVNDEEANALLTRTYRAPFTVPEQV